MLGDMKYVYQKLDILQKKDFLKLVFDINLYYQEGIYQTPNMLSVFSSNHLITEEKGLLDYHKKRDNFSIIPSSGVEGTTIEHLIPILTFFESLK